MTDSNPWKLKGSKQVYSNPWIDVEEHDVVRPDGSDGIYGVVKFKNVAMGVVPLFENGDVLLVGQYRYVLDRYSWEIPEGGRLNVEAQLDGIKRELLEETGYEAGEWLKLGEADLSNSITNEYAQFYLARDLKKVSDPSPDPSEELEVKRVPFGEVLEMIEVGEIRDSVTIMACLMLSRKIDKGIIKI